MPVITKYVLLAVVMIVPIFTPLVAAANCRKVGEAAIWIYKIYEQDRPISDVMDVIDSRGLDGLTKDESRELALDVHQWMDTAFLDSAKDARDFFERRCFKAKYG